MGTNPQRVGSQPLTPPMIAGIGIIGLALLCLLLFTPLMLIRPRAAPSVQNTQQALDLPGPLPTMLPTVTAVPGIAIVSGGDCNVSLENAQFSGGDSYDTTYVSCVALNQRSEPVTIESGSEAHNWLFNGQAGQDLRIRVGGTDGIDPRIRLLNPYGEVIAEQDDDDQKNVDFRIVLPDTGVYVIRVDIFSAGTYTVLVETQWGDGGGKATMESYPPTMQPRRTASPLVIILAVMGALLCLCLGLAAGGYFLMGAQVQQVYDEIERQIENPEAFAPAPAEVVIPTIESLTIPTVAPSLPEQGGLPGAMPGCNADLPQASFVGNISYDTTFVGCVELGAPSPPTPINTVFEGHNWLFEGQAGQTVRIRVGGDDGIDPRVNLIDPAGDVLASEDDNVGEQVDFTYTLPASGVYVIRLDVWNQGVYTVLVEAQ